MSLDAHAPTCLENPERLHRPTSLVVETPGRAVNKPGRIGACRCADDVREQPVRCRRRTSWLEKKHRQQQRAHHDHNGIVIRYLQRQPELMGSRPVFGLSFWLKIGKASASVVRTRRTVPFGALQFLTIHQPRIVFSVGPVSSDGKNNRNESQGDAIDCDGVIDAGAIEQSPVREHTHTTIGPRPIRADAPRRRRRPVRSSVACREDPRVAFLVDISIRFRHRPAFPYLQMFPSKQKVVVQAGMAATAFLSCLRIHRDQMGKKIG
jgi:hypothetical protein